ncbi:MAG: hypothetical protein JWR25_817 [Noviherbaspirillum sp.]|nr:hypothetical protein [Noviherbaspirillum sp.]
MPLVEVANQMPEQIPHLMPESSWTPIYALQSKLRNLSPHPQANIWPRYALTSRSFNTAPLIAPATASPTSWTTTSTSDSTTVISSTTSVTADITPPSDSGLPSRADLPNPAIWDCFERYRDSQLFDSVAGANDLFSSLLRQRLAPIEYCGVGHTTHALLKLANELNSSEREVLNELNLTLPSLLGIHDSGRERDLYFLLPNLVVALAGLRNVTDVDDIGSQTNIAIHALRSALDSSRANSASSSSSSSTLSTSNTSNTSSSTTSTGISSSAAVDAMQGRDDFRFTNEQVVPPSSSSASTTDQHGGAHKNCTPC